MRATTHYFHITRLQTESADFFLQVSAVIQNENLQNSAENILVTTYNYLKQVKYFALSSLAVNLIFHKLWTQLFL